MGTRDASTPANAAAIAAAIRPLGASATTNAVDLAQASAARERGGAAEAGAKASGAAVAAAFDLTPLPMRMAALSVAPPEAARPANAALPAALALTKPAAADASATPSSAIGAAADKSKLGSRQTAGALVRRRMAMNAKFLTNPWRGRTR